MILHRLVSIFICVFCSQNRSQQANEKRYVKQLKEVKETKMKHFVGMQKGEYKTLKCNYKKVFVVWFCKQTFVYLCICL